MKGAGVSSQIAKLCAKFKIESLELLPSFLAMMKTKKDHLTEASDLQHRLKKKEPSLSPTRKLRMTPRILTKQSMRSSLCK